MEKSVQFLSQEQTSVLRDIHIKEDDFAEMKDKLFKKFHLLSWDDDVDHEREEEESSEDKDRRETSLQDDIKTRDADRTWNSLHERKELLIKLWTREVYPWSFCLW
jgi:hypothetical protein